MSVWYKKESPRNAEFWGLPSAGYQINANSALTHSSTRPFNMIPFIPSVNSLFGSLATTSPKSDEMFKPEKNMKTVGIVQPPKLQCPAHQTSATSLAFSRYSWWTSPDFHDLEGGIPMVDDWHHDYDSNKDQGFESWNFSLQQQFKCLHIVKYGPCSQLFLGDSSPFDWLMRPSRILLVSCHFSL